MNVLSLFDGMSCGMIALDRLGIKVDKYYASEIDKYAMQVSQANYPDIIHVGDITKLDLSTLPQIDLVMGGSPCQGFSFAGKQLAFDDPRSMLFFEFVKCVKELKPKYFLLENVRMKKEYLDVISEYMGVDPIFINSSLVSAQSRQRYYWTNIPSIEQPKDREIVLSDMLEDDAEEPMYSNIYGGFGEKKPREHYGKSVTIRANSGGGSIPNVKLKDNLTNLPKKAHCIKANYYKSSKANFENDTTKGGKFSATGIPQKLVSDKPQHIGTAVDVKAAAYRARSVDENGKRVAWKDAKPKQMLELRKDEKSNSVTSVQKDNVLTQDEVYWRKLTPLECERLQTVPDNYTNHVSNTQRYKMLGNGWTIEVIAHILKNMESV